MLGRKAKGAVVFVGEEVDVVWDVEVAGARKAGEGRRIPVPEGPLEAVEALSRRELRPALLRRGLMRVGLRACMISRGGGGEGKNDLNGRRTIPRI